MDENFKKQYNQSETIAVRLAVEEQRRQLFHRHMIGSAIGSTVIAIIMALMFWQHDESNIKLFVWLFCIACFIAFRAIQGFQFSRCPINSKKAQFWEKLIYIYTIGAGLTWGLSPYVFQPETTHEQIFTALYACGLIAAAVVSLSARMIDYLLFTGSIAACMISFHLTSDYPYSNLTGLLFFIYYAASSGFARNVKLLQQASIDLIEKNIDLIDDLMVEKENAERSNKEKTRFIANASHDLRQPLHALGLYLDSLGSDRPIEEKQEVLEKSKRSLKSLDDLFSSLLDISNIDAGAITIAPLHFRLSQLFEQITDQVRGSANEKNIHVHIDVDYEHIVFCDPVLTGRCLRNVVINAIKHSACSDIYLSTVKHDRHIEIKIADNGKGIPKENLGSIFEEFHQLDNPHRDRQKGLGLGLTIVKRLLELQGHQFSIDSVINKGTDFHIFLPHGNKGYINNIMYDDKKIKKIQFTKSILVIDDEQQVLDGMGIILSDWEQKIQLASSVEDAVKMIGEGFSPDVIISDYRLQNNTTGADAIEQIKSKLNAKTQIVFVTGETEPNKIKEIRAHGYPLIHKPIMGAGLKSILTRLDNNPDIGKLKVIGN
ncbi:MAG: ATP-binding protein [Arenicella sp.]